MHCPGPGTPGVRPSVRPSVHPAAPRPLPSPNTPGINRPHHACSQRLWTTGMQLRCSCSIPCLQNKLQPHARGPKKPLPTVLGSHQRELNTRALLCPRGTRHCQGSAYPGHAVPQGTCLNPLVGVGVGLSDWAKVTPESGGIELSSVNPDLIVYQRSRHLGHVCSGLGELQGSQGGADLPRTWGANQGVHGGHLGSYFWDPK